MSVFQEKIKIKMIEKGRYEIITKNMNIYEGIYDAVRFDNILVMKQEFQKEKSENITPKKDIPNISQMKENFFVFEDQKQAKELSDILKEDIKKGSIIGIKGFDNKYYVFKRDFFDELNSSIRNILSSRGETKIEEIIEILNVDEHAIKGTIEIIKEQGDIVELKKGKYKLI